MKNFWSFFRSLKKSFTDAFLDNEYIIRLRKKYPRLFGFIGKRLSGNDSYGFSFSLGVVLSALAFFYFLVIAQDILARDPFVEADIRIMNLIAAFRSITTAKVLLFFTYLGNWQIIVSLGIVLVVILWLAGRKRMSSFFIWGILTSELAYTMFKLFLHRVRPDIGFSLIPRNGYAFPSGHAVIPLIFYGMIGYGLLKMFKKLWQKLLVTIPAVILIFLIGFSRIYLGVHWVSDVVAGWLFGLALLILFITLFEQRQKFAPQTKTKNILSNNFVVLIAVFLLIFEGAFLFYFYRTHSLIEPLPQNPEKIVISRPTDLEPLIFSENFPKFSETFVGQKMEPISFIIIGSKEELFGVFQKSGWFIAGEPHRLAGLYGLAVAAIFNKPYPTAPVTPSFLNAQPNTIAFQKATEANTVRQRHHTRFWLTNYYLDGAPVWVATASFDDGLRYLITHKIRPDIDTERDFIKDDLVKTNLVKEAREIQLVEPLLGKNQSGDQFFTDGKAYLLFLR